MPRLNDGLSQHKLPTGHYGYSAVGLDKLGATEYTLVTIVQDVSSSVTGFKTEMEKALKEIITACKFSPRADNLMIRFVQFNEKLHEAHGFKLLEQCNPDDYDNSLSIGGMTALRDAAENAISATADYAKQLTENDFSVNAIVFVVTDGCDNQSTLSTKQVKQAMSAAMKKETLESIVTVLIGVNLSDIGVKQELDNFNQEAGMSQFVDIGNASAKTLAKLAEFVSKSISAQSQSLGTGQPSQPLNLYL